MEPRSAPELAESLGVHVRTSRRLLRRLEAEGYVRMVPGRRRRYRPTMRIVALAGQVVHRSELAQKAAPHVAALREEVGGECHLCVPSHLQALCIVHDCEQAPGQYRPYLRELVPCHCTASGKALLAWRDEWREAVLTRPLERHTDHTIVGPEWLRVEARRTVVRGYAIEHREFHPEVSGVAAPVFSDGEAVAAMAVVEPTPEFAFHRFRELGEIVTQAASTLSRSLATLIPARRT
jgi:DNA-binding IclR family transcriptional regulator